MPKTFPNIGRKLVSGNGCWMMIFPCFLSTLNPLSLVFEECFWNLVDIAELFETQMRFQFRKLHTNTISQHQSPEINFSNFLIMISTTNSLELRFGFCGEKYMGIPLCRIHLPKLNFPFLFGWCFWLWGKFSGVRINWTSDSDLGTVHTLYFKVYSPHIYQMTLKLQLTVNKYFHIFLGNERAYVIYSISKDKGLRTTLIVFTWFY